MSDLEDAVNDLVLCNRILAHENVVDAFGHVSMRHPHDPGKYLLSRARSPELVELAEAKLAGDGVSVDEVRQAIAPMVEQPRMRPICP